jgi:hypothetical protein
VIVSDHEAYTPFFVFTLLHVTLAAALLQNTHAHYNPNASHTKLTSAFLAINAQPLEKVKLAAV